jgi:hypothetical protein
VARSSRCRRTQACATKRRVLGLTWNEFALVAFLFVLITAFGWLPRVGEWIGAFAGGVKRGARQPPASGSSSGPPAPDSAPKPPSQS